MTIIVQLNRNKNYKSVTIGFLVSDGFRILGKVPDSVGFGCAFGIRHIPTRPNCQNQGKPKLWVLQ